MLPRKPELLISCAACGLLAIGCDPVRTTLLQVRLQVTNPSSGQPVAGANVLLKAPYGGADEELKGLSDEQWLERPLLPVHSGSANAQGTADIDVKITAIDHSIGSLNPPDRVSGVEYICKITQDEAHEVLRLKMQPGASVRGESFAVSVAEVGQPRYVETD